MKLENKELFVKRLNDALIECGAGRYSHLVDAPLRYERIGASERVHQGGLSANVTCDSLTALAYDLHEQIFR